MHAEARRALAEAARPRRRAEVIINAAQSAHMDERLPAVFTAVLSISGRATIDMAPLEATSTSLRASILG
jgi:hypothetical protein